MVLTWGEASNKISEESPFTKKSHTLRSEHMIQEQMISNSLFEVVAKIPIHAEPVHHANRVSEVFEANNGFL